MTSHGPRVFRGTVLGLVALYALLRFGVPHLAVWLGLAQYPAPVPAFAMTVYMLCAVVGALVYVSSDERRWASFLRPLADLLRLAPGPGFRLRLFVLAVIPLACGWWVWRRVAPAAQVPPVIRLQHPTMPETFGALENPYEGRTTEATRDGVVLYQKNCRPCHGAVADGTGPLARGLRLKPVDFTDGGAIASVVAAYPFWRIRSGHAGLPPIATPWNSAMPSWESQLTDDEIWRIVTTEYWIAGTEPRRPEGSRP